MQTALRIGIFGVIIWFGGFFWFVDNLTREGDINVAMEISALTRADTGIIALTGESGRIKAAVDLLEGNAGAKILISGVHPETGKAELAAQIEGTDDIFDCCIDLGQRAQTTKGNAVEARDWIKAHGYDQAILVTTDYHIPRAVAEVRALMPDVEVVVYPVASKSAPEKDWHSSPHAWRILMTEYMKFLAVSVGQLLPGT